MGFITTDGENQIAAKQGAEQTLNIVSFVLANIDGLDPDNEPVNRIEAMPDAGDIMATLPVTKSGYVNTNQVVYSLVMDSSLGDYDFNWLGLLDDEGELIAVEYTPVIQKRANNGAVPGNNLSKSFLIAYSGIQATTAIAVSAETWQIDFNARLHGIDERERLSNYDVYGHEGFFGLGWQVVRQGATTTYDVLPGIGYVGGVRIASAVSQEITAAGPPASVWLDVSLQGDISDVSAVVSFTIDAVGHTDYTDGLGFNHYVTKIADIAADGSVTDARVNSDGLADHLADSDPHTQYLLKSNVVTEAAAKLGTATIARSWTAQRVKQAINALAAVKMNHIINGNFAVNQLEVTGTVVLAAGEHGHDKFKAGASGCTYTFATSAGVTTLTITAGALQHVVEGLDLLTQTMTLSWVGTSQGKIAAGSYADSPISAGVTGGADLTVEFGAGTLSKVKLETGSVSTEFQKIPYGLELALCQRFAFKINQSEWGVGVRFDSGRTCRSRIDLPVTMRAVPTASVGAVTYQWAAGSKTGTSLAATATESDVRLRFTASAITDSDGTAVAFKVTDLYLDANL